MALPSAWSRREQYDAPISFVPAPNAPINLKNTMVGNGGNVVVNLSWVDNSKSETNWKIQRSLDNMNWATIATIPSITGPTTGTAVFFTDNTVANKMTYYYRVMATNIVGDTTVYTPPTVGYPTMSVDSLPSNVQQVNT